VIRPGALQICRFGDVEVDENRMELRRGGSAIEVEPKSLRVLFYLIHNRDRVVTKEELIREVWAGSTVTDNALTRSVAQLRKALNDDARQPRYIETVPTVGYRFLPAVEEAFEAAPEEAKAGSRRKWLWPGLALVVLVAAVAAVWRWRAPADDFTRLRLSQITMHSGLTNSPALSPDGKLVAYSSDPNDSGQRDIFVRQVVGGPALRLTFDGAGNTTPDFSPDGSRIVFHSNRAGGGVYEVPALGGAPQLIAPGGLNPKFSPNGAQIAYWTGAPNVSIAVPGGGAVWVVAAAGGEPRHPGGKFTNARYPIWSPDGKYLLFVGYTSESTYEQSALDWYLAPANGGKALRTGAFEALKRAGLDARELNSNPAASFGILGLPKPGCWLARDNRVIFSTATGAAWNLWQTRISSRGTIDGSLRRLTAGAGNESDPSCGSNGAVAFTGTQLREDVWVLPIDLNQGKPVGSMKAVTESPAVREHASLSRDGRYVAYASTQSGRMGLWMRDLETGEESSVASSPFVRRYVVVSPSGRTIAFSSFENEKRVIYISALNGALRKVCETCFRATDWSSDEKTLLVFEGNPYRVSLLDIATRRLTPILSKPKRHLLYARFSPDNRWISFTERVDPDHAWIVIAPVKGTEPIPEAAWIRITDSGLEDWANWSPDGNTLYFTSSRDGHTCFWAQRLDPETHKAAGDAFAVQHLHARLSYQQGGWSAAGGRIAMVLREDTGNIWMMSASDAR
jgi:Tol biopolymer transport system component/DNA-binding winged helix-turn-helix (wHTH) protein